MTGNDHETLTQKTEQNEVFKSVKLIIFDLYDTTVNLNGAIRLQAINHGLNNPGRIVELWRKQYVRLMKETQLAVEKDPNAWKPLDELMAEGLDIAMPNLDVSARQDLLSAWSNPLLWPEVLDVLNSLRQKGYVLATMSNASEKMQRNIAEAIGFEFDHYISPDKVHAYKPDSVIFKQALAAGNGYKPNEIIMVANFPGDLDTASSVGFKTAFINRDNLAVPANYDLVTPDFTALVGSLPSK